MMPEILTANRNGARLDPANATPRAPFEERHYTVIEIAQLWSLSTDAVRKLFQDEAGVMVMGKTISTRSKRRYRTLRIPESVLNRVHRRLSNPCLRAGRVRP